ncbi:nucleophile aminohydrolase [Lipomyces tetrasporus]|uniref:Nucleophile aminohydrolase n=1 Tax=Lipomyces tetrasporus TaxID=54092 RepID=A0AAD7QN12_9ASCO|nr:nucleophile aminohydrolase [Lipomyces tetrasporus]KAJ8096902.1 nucleophile aminohydrolase [Lipomyces tetrasporus]
MVFIAVHIGAGFHSKKREYGYNELCRRACIAGTKLLNSGLSSVAAAAQVCKILEDDEITNSGTGSNLTTAGEIECDASIMSTYHNRGAAVGCVSGVKNPVLAAEKLLSESFKPLSHGRVSPLFLVAHGARQFAENVGLELATKADMLSDSAIIRFEHWNEVFATDVRTAGMHNNLDNGNEDMITDTVGVICLDQKGELAVASSSGGVAMKQPGRIGPASMIGSGVWTATTQDRKIAVCSSGTGEDIITTNLAYRCAEAQLTATDELESLSMLMKNDFLRSQAIQLKPPAAGILSIKLTKSDESHMLSLYYAHTTPSMSVGYMAASARNPTVLMSRIKIGGQPVIGEYAKRINLFDP